MTDRNVTVKLVADVDEYVKEMERATEATKLLNDEMREQRRLHGEGI